MNNNLVFCIVISFILVAVEDSSFAGEHDGSQAYEVISFKERQWVSANGRAAGDSAQNPWKFILSYNIEDDSEFDVSSSNYILSIANSVLGLSGDGSSTFQCDIETGYLDILRERFFPPNAGEKGWRFRYDFPACNGNPPLTIRTRCLPEDGLWQEVVRQRVTCGTKASGVTYFCGSLPVDRQFGPASVRSSLLETSHSESSIESQTTCSTKLTFGSIRGEVVHGGIGPGFIEILDSRFTLEERRESSTVPE